jgi:type I restriction-modification system DNA methylase subunit
VSDENTVPQAVFNLIQRYEAYRQAYLRGDYNETQLRREFVDPLFRALGWDVDNNQGFAEAYKEVVHEQTIKFRGQDTNTKFIDYSFRLGGVMKFIVETKKPSVKIAEDAKSALQVRRYAWNAKLTLNILTNFEEWAIYDCRIRPETNDASTKGRIKYFSYKDLVKEWDYLSSIFTKTAIQHGSFDAYASEAKGKKGTASVDDTFLSEIEEWRDRLAKNIAIRNTSLSVDELNDAVQKTIDRIIFLRICEDRGIEKYETLKKVLEGPDTYKQLCALFLDADERYNSGLFHFREEKGNPEKPDEYTLTLKIDDKILKDLIKRLYYPESPFEFSVMPPAILGHVYEQFLGKVIRLTEGHQARVEYKPEVKKAGGVFYTPEYIVDYIARHTVGELVKDKTPKEVSKIRVLDPACGSGSFLLGAYQYLLDWHRDWYINNLVHVVKDKGATSPEVKALQPPDARGYENLPIYKASNGVESRVRSDWKLTTAERKRILLNNIYGVDIDRQAVEVTKLSLLLKVLEEENEETVSKQLTLFKERALPSLHENIKCGNSLIGSDIYQDVQVTLDDREVVKRINAFDWDQEFPEIMQKGGFDAVIGNPPYVRQELISAQKEYLQLHYQTYQGTADLYIYFIEKGISLLRKGGIFSYIVANKWMRANYGKPLRNWISRKRIDCIIDFGDLPVFSNATTYPCIIQLSNTEKTGLISLTTIPSLDFLTLDEYIKNHENLINQDFLVENGWIITSSKNQDLLKKVLKTGIKLGEYVNSRIYNGIKTGLNAAFIIDKNTRDILISEDDKNQNLIQPFVFGKDIKRYESIDPKKYIIFIPWHFPLTDQTSITTSSKEAEIAFRKDYPSVYNHFLRFKKELEGRAKSETGIRYEWYALQRYRPKYYKEYGQTKIIYAEIAQRGQFSFDYCGSYTDMTAPCIISDSPYLLGILNSSLISFVFSNIASTIRGGFCRWKEQYMNQIPIRPIDFSDPIDQARHDKMVALVERMLALHKEKADVKTDHEKNLVGRQIEATDKQIDTLVYELYGLTSEEIQIVEGVGK